MERPEADECDIFLIYNILQLVLSVNAKRVAEANYCALYKPGTGSRLSCLARLFTWLSE